MPLFRSKQSVHWQTLSVLHGEPLTHIPGRRKNKNYENEFKADRINTAWYSPADIAGVLADSVSFTGSIASFVAAVRAKVFELYTCTKSYIKYKPV